MPCKRVTSRHILPHSTEIPPSRVHPEVLVRSVLSISTDLHREENILRNIAKSPYADGAKLITCVETCLVVLIIYTDRLVQWVQRTRSDVLWTWFLLYFTRCTRKRLDWWAIRMSRRWRNNPGSHQPLHIQHILYVVGKRLWYNSSWYQQICLGISSKLAWHRFIRVVQPWGKMQYRLVVGWLAVKRGSVELGIIERLVEQGWERQWYLSVWGCHVCTASNKGFWTQNAFQGQYNL